MRRMETDTCRVGDDCRNNNRTTQVLLEFSSCLPREEICDLQFAPSIQLTQCSVFTTKIQLLSPGSGEQGQMLLQEHEGMCVCVCVCVCSTNYIVLLRFTMNSRKMSPNWSTLGHPAPDIKCYMSPRKIWVHGHFFSNDQCRSASKRVQPCTTTKT